VAQPHPDPHVALSVAAALAHSQLSENPRVFYDVEHYSETLNLAARALASAAVIHVAESDHGGWRALTDAELAAASIQRGATLLVLADGRTFRHLSVLRSDLRSAIALLRAAGVKAFGTEPAKPQAKT
jgi:hypothetical protein